MIELIYIATSALDDRTMQVSESPLDYDAPSRIGIFQVTPLMSHQSRLQPVTRC